MSDYGGVVLFCEPFDGETGFEKPVLSWYETVEKFTLMNVIAWYVS